ncbi:SpvB/TcaC N-terminal domain-containing protein [Dactylosporangium sp. CA-092794]|uniref:SpvB/TcaC N-terminal domain-containing protein n=1 Tax=Dactylosporangium sp. CA-092794 TaxID=3239929 RepID=UPI003D9112D4
MAHPQAPGEQSAGPPDGSSDPIRQGPAGSAAPAIALPKGGGAIRGIGEKFEANPLTGTGSLSLPLPISAGRPGLQPELALSYDSGRGNGPFGLGWSIDLPAITRKTDLGLPRYDDAAESDVFILFGAEDLVPAFRLTGTGELERDARQRPIRDEDDRDGYHIVRYRPRTEGSFARIERWAGADPADVFWRVITPDNVTSVYGRDRDSRVFDSAAEADIFSWLICERYDDKGNGIRYTYKAEDGAGVRPELSYERHRRGAPCTTQRYLKSIRYGNVVSRLHPEPPGDRRDDWLFEVVFDYGEGHYADLPPDPGTPADEQHRYSHAAPAGAGPWPVRPDPFSTYRAGFEIRTYRRCHRVLMFHRIPELGAEPCLVRALELGYADLDPTAPAGAELAHAGSTRFASFLVSATRHGYERAAPGVTAGPHDERYVRYLKQSMPAVEFAYSRPVIDTEAGTLGATSAANLPAGLAEEYLWLDLDAEGLSGVLTDQGGAWWYKRNLGGGRFDALEPVARRPVAGPARRRLLDLAGDGALDLVELDGDAAGFYKRTEDGDWAPHRAFTSMPNLRWDDPNLRLIDLDGDGRADVLITGQAAFTWHPSLAEDGFGPPRRAVHPLDDEDGPRLVFADGTDSVFVADMSGDGLVDLVRITNGAVCYWPNLGYGRFGARIVMENAPRFDDGDQFDPHRIRLADIDGSGVTDIVYLGRDGASAYLNQSGNRWTGAVVVTGFALTDGTSAVSVVDLLGDGTACLVWSSPLPADAGAPLRYIRLMAAGKPHLLVEVRNNLGARTTIGYTSSTRYYLADRELGQPWISRLPFPVHVVERVETTDLVSRNRFVSRYEYHHGYFDGAEREFRGFGRVDRYDTEEYDPSAPPPGPDPEPSAPVPPVLTRTWFHLGIPPDRGGAARRYEREYYREPGLLDDPWLPAGLTIDEERQAGRALRGSMLRQEVYGLDGSAREQHPYLVAMESAAIRLVQPQDANRHAVFLTHPSEVLGCRYERDPADPRVTHAMTLEVNPFGQVTHSARIAYGRRAADGDLPPEVRDEQRRHHVTCADTAYTNALVSSAETPDDHRLPAPFRTRTYHLTGLDLPPGQARFTARQVRAAIAAADGLEYAEEPAGGRPERRLIGHERIRYRKDDLSGPCDWGRIEGRAVPFERYRLAFTPGLLSRTYAGTTGGAERLPADAAAVLPVGADAAGRGGYVDLDGDGAWWVPAGRAFYGPAAQELGHALRHFFLPHRHRDPFHTEAAPTESAVGYDPHDLRTVATTDALGNRVTAELDYRVLAPKLVTDANGNRSAVAFDALGGVVATAVTGPAGAGRGEGDELAGFAANLTPAQVRRAFADPFADPHALLGRATSRLIQDLFAYQRTSGDPRPAPAAVYALRRQTHESALAAGARTEVQHAFSYSDGFGREIQTKTQADPGPWTGTGWTVFNNKGKPVRQYEPFFSDTHRCDFEARIGVATTLFYDPAGRVVATLHPDHTYGKVVFDPWRQLSYDANDTAAAHGEQTGDPRTDPDIAALVRRHFEREDPDWQTWLARRQRAGADAGPADAAAKAAAHADTPAAVHLDPLGRPVLTRAHNGFAADGSPIRLDTRAVFDIEGNQRALVDAEGRTVVTYDYDMLGNRTRQSGMEGGERWILPDVTGRPLRAWDGRGHGFRTEYDALRRPVRYFVQGFSPTLSDPGTLAGPVLYARTEYGEGQTGAAARNLRGRVFRQFDGAGVLTHGYDFKGNVTRQAREVTAAFTTAVDWGSAQPPGERFVAETRYDALDRPVQLLAPHPDRAAAGRNVVQPVYNAANQVRRLDVWTGRAGDPDGLLDPAAEPPSAVGVDRIDYDAHGRRTKIAYRNGVTTTYAYDPDTFRLVRLSTGGLQDLYLTHDAAGNVTRIRDDAQQAVFFRNQVVEASTDYTYDAVYRLIQALGREHVGQAGGAGIPHSFRDARRSGLPHPGDGAAMGRYCETYEYDRAGNLLAMRHGAACPGALAWTRTYTYDEATQLDDRDAGGVARRSNRLSATTVAGATETLSVDGDGYDPHGNLLRLAHLRELVWDFQDRLRMTRRQAVGPDDADGTERRGERTYYAYDAGGQRVRKVTVGAGGALKEERLYLGGFEVYRKLSGNDAGLVRETLHVMDGDQRIALVETRNDVDDGTPALAVRYQLGGHLGSVRLELDELARIISYEEYAPYGSTTYQAVRTDVRGTAKRYRYAGKERDEESGLYYHGARYAAPWLGRWISVDPLPDVNGYYYCRGNPIILADPDGRAPVVTDELRPDAGAAPPAGKPQAPTLDDLKDLLDESGRGSAQADSYNDTLEGPQVWREGEDVYAYPPRIVHGPKPEAAPATEREPSRKPLVHRDPGEPVPAKEPETSPPPPPADHSEPAGESPPMVFDEVTIFGKAPRREAPTWVFPPVDIFGKVVRQHEAPPPPPKYESTSIQFKTVRPVFDDPSVAEFRDKDYVTDIQHVADILKREPRLNVGIEAHVGYEGRYAWPEWAGGKPRGRSPAVYKEVGPIMDARARAVKDALIKAGVPEDRITTMPGEAGVGKANQRVDFYFYPRP